MTIDEHELSPRLEETAAQASAPQFTAGELVSRIRRRRARVAGAVAVAGVAAIAVAVGVPVALLGPGQPAGAGSATQPGIIRPTSLPAPGYSITVNGQTQAPPASYSVTPGENLAITLNVTVPAHQSLRALWVGITNGVLAPRPGGPLDMSPILAGGTGTPLGPGTHQFRWHWVVPGGLRGGESRQLSAEWLWSGSGDSGEAFIAELNVAGTSG
jgi:hypothetical protein